MKQISVSKLGIIACAHTHTLILTHRDTPAYRHPLWHWSCFTAFIFEPFTILGGRDTRLSHTHTHTNEDTHTQFLTHIHTHKWTSRFSYQSELECYITSPIGTFRLSIDHQLLIFSSVEIVFKVAHEWSIAREGKKSLASHIKPMLVLQVGSRQISNREVKLILSQAN